MAKNITVNTMVKNYYISYTNTKVILLNIITCYNLIKFRETYNYKMDTLNLFNVI